MKPKFISIQITLINKNGQSGVSLSMTTEKDGDLTHQHFSTEQGMLNILEPIVNALKRGDDGIQIDLDRA